MILRNRKLKNFLSITVILFTGTSISFYVNAQGKNNFDGSYTIDYGETKCGNLGYAFKLLHQRDGYSSVSAMYKSNCKINPQGKYEGYIYPKKMPNLRIFWVQVGKNVTYKD